ncbi:MAG: UDP-N-acetylmuramate dehydrogenase [Candidatus Eisenbacteria sp.]|nr:UDP-N-acetylmuramate dehydrogenase [Candidatus Eisenbacteria bacterium]
METDPKLLVELERMAPGRVLVAEPMARHTSFGLGGPADLFVEPTDPSTFRECTDYLTEAGIPITLLGLGTNVLVRSGGIDGAVMTGTKAFTKLMRTHAGVRAGGGVSLTRLLSFCAESGLSGLEGLSGIPGSAGGAVATNAGSFGVSIGDSLTGVTVSKPGGSASFVPRDELQLVYRTIGLSPGTFIEEIDLSLDLGEPADIKAAQRETLERKWKTQPSGMRCAGCVFRNAAGDAAGKLIDEAGLKGLRVGGAVISDLHANFILNDRGATSEDVAELIEIVRERVADAAGVTLELEIEVVGRR